MSLIEAFLLREKVHQLLFIPLQLFSHHFSLGSFKRKERKRSEERQGTKKKENRVERKLQIFLLPSIVSGSGDTKVRHELLFQEFQELVRERENQERKRERESRKYYRYKGERRRQVTKKLAQQV